MTPYEQAVEDAAKAMWEALNDPPVDCPWEAYQAEHETYRAMVRAALPHLRKLHYLEAADSIDQWAGTRVTPYSELMVRQTADFLRGLAESSEGR